MLHLQNDMPSRSRDKTIKRVMRGLCQSGSYFKACENKTGEPCFGLFAKKNNFQASTLFISESFMNFLVSQEWVKQQECGRFYLSDIGGAWFRRVQAGGEAFRDQHMITRFEKRRLDGQQERIVRVNEGEAPLGWLRKRKDRNGVALISEAQFQAGERLRADYHYALLSPQITANWSGMMETRSQKRGAPNESMTLRENVLAAKQRVNEAIDSVGPELAGILINICCHLQGLEEAEKLNGWPQRSGKVVLQLALERLARHYGLIEDKSSSLSRQGKIKHWGAKDYKPRLDQQ